MGCGRFRYRENAERSMGARRVSNSDLLLERCLLTTSCQAFQDIEHQDPALRHLKTRGEHTQGMISPRRIPGLPVRYFMCRVRGRGTGSLLRLPYVA